MKVVRVYEDSKGHRVLVDRLWPRGVSKQRIDTWLKEIAPSKNLLQWYHEDNNRYPQFAKTYAQELLNNPAVKQLKAIKDAELVTAVKDIEHSHIPVLLTHINNTQV